MPNEEKPRFAIVVRHVGFVERFIKSATPPTPSEIKWSLWWANKDDALTFASLADAEQTRAAFLKAFEGSPAYTFAIMQEQLIPIWTDITPGAQL